MTTSYATRPCDTVKSNAAVSTAARTKGSTTAWHDRLDVQYVSVKALAAQTITAGTFSAVWRTVESVATADFYQQIVIRVMSGDGLTERGTLFGGETLTAVSATVGAQNEEISTTSSTRIKNAISTTQVVAQAGDRIVIEVGCRGGGTVTTVTFNNRFGDPTASGDFALTSGLTTDICPWVELSNNLTWFTPASLRQITSPFPAVVRAACW